MGFDIQHTSIGRSHFHDFIFSQIQLFRLCVPVLIGSDGVHDFPCACTHSSVLRHNVLCGDDFIYRPRFPGHFIDRGIDAAVLG